MRCPNCSKTIKDGAIICTHCSSAVGWVEDQVLFEAEDGTSLYRWQQARVELGLTPGALRIYGYPYGNPTITVRVSELASCQLVERRDLGGLRHRMSEVSGGGGDLLGLVVDLLLVVFLALIDHLFIRSTKVQVLKLTQSASYDSRQGWVIHLRSSRRGEKGQVATLQMARRFVAFLRQAGYRGAIPEELSVPMDLEAVPADAKALRPRTGDSRRYHKVAMLVSILLSLPIVACASSLWILAGWAGSDQVLYRLGDSIFTLGAPLTMLVLKFPDYAGRYLTSKDDLWAIPLIGLLFIMQWLIWGQLLVLIIRRLRARRDQVP